MPAFVYKVQSHKSHFHSFTTEPQASLTHVVCKAQSNYVGLQKDKPMAVGGIGMISTANCKPSSPA